MILRIEYLDNEIEIDNNKILAIEIENKKYFYRIVSNLYSLSNGEKIEEIQLYDDSMKELSSNNLYIVNDFFNLDFENKKMVSELQKNIISSIDDKSMQELINIYKKIYNSFNKILNNIDLPITMNQDFNLDLFIKLLKISVSRKEELLDNLLLLIDINKILELHQTVFFINLKQYLNNTELIELYKYSIYNEVKIVLIDSQSYGTTLEYEKKLIVDENLDEFMI